ncbi:PH domain-containing protein [Gleimia sp. 6138-11-ORH1]|uniref:PH domain-containing protein n=1 Tax=Gleimia sp. 6138-11-ORH1 TaxID=2973937 RepID=UPI0021677293|nr:PH domain-containing protein [Gleimia sp. 6138-11-ORH1]MCS4484763.1 PH domain-containing protein [Gleimia sp. 6138-11-ORH1]
MAKQESVIEIGLDPQVWRALHPLTPLANTWSTFVAIIGVLTWQSYRELSRLFSSDVLWSPAYAGYSTITVIVFAVFSGAFLISLLVGIYSFVAWRKMRYAITSEAVYFKEGIIFHSQRIAKLNRIQAVNITHPLFGRIFGLGKIDIEVAGGSDSNLILGLLKTSELESVRLEILQHLKAAKAAQLNHTALEDENLTAVTPAQNLALENTQSDLGAAASKEISYTEIDAITNAEIEGNLIFSVPVTRLLLSQLVNIGVLISLALGVASFAVAYILFFSFGAGLGSLLAIGSIGFGSIAYIFNSTASNFNFRAYLAEDGIRIRAGLLETRSQTIAPHRIHAVQITQPFFWRFFGWYKVHFTQAAFQGASSDQKADINILLPVGTKEEMFRAVWMIFPDLGVENPIQTLQVGLEGAGDGDGYVNNPKRSRIFQPLTYVRNAFCLTEKVLLVRSGRITRSLSITSYSRMQSCYLQQGPFARWRKLAQVQLNMVGNVFSGLDGATGNLDEQVAVDLFQELNRRSIKQRILENPASWHQRVQTGLESAQTYQDSSDVSVPENSF